MNIKIKKMNERAIMPTKAHGLDAGFDFTAIEEHIDIHLAMVSYKLGWAVEIPAGHVGLLMPRSSIINKDLTLANSVGLIDAGFTGELTANFKNLKQMKAKKYSVGDRVVQLVILPIPQIDLVVVDELTKPEQGRGTEGFGSSGR
jgi:dUTP pyrophosphatase